MGKITASHIKTMREHLGEASNLIKSDAYLPMFRNRQIKYPEEFAESVRQAAKKRNPEKWLSKVWACANIGTSLKMLGKYIARARAAAQEAAARLKNTIKLSEINHSGLNRLASLKASAKSTVGNLLL